MGLAIRAEMKRYLFDNHAVIFVRHGFFDHLSVHELKVGRLFRNGEVGARGHPLFRNHSPILAGCSERIGT
jgi:hypothetical protein